MAATITFRPRAGIREALDLAVDAGEGDRSAIINAALADYLDVKGDEESREDPREPVPTTPRRRARQAVPSVGEPPPCPHPKASLKKLPYGNQCTECGQMVKP